MATQLSQKPEITLIDVLPLVFKYADLAGDMSRIRLISKACPSIVEEACLRFELKFRSADDCIAGTNYFQQVLAKNKNIEVLHVDINRNYRHSDPEDPSPEELAVQDAAYALPLQRLFATSPTQWPNLKELKLTTFRSAGSPFGPLPDSRFTSARFPNLERLTLCYYSFPEDFQLELPKLSVLVVSTSLVTNKALTRILCNQYLPSLAELYLDNSYCEDWRAFKDIHHRNLKHLRVDSEVTYGTDFLVNLQRGAGKGLQNLESLYLRCSDEPIEDLDLVDSLFVNNTDFKNLKHLVLEFRWFGPQSPADFLKLARACPNLEKLELGDWFNEPYYLLGGEEEEDEEIRRFHETLEDHFKVLDEENAREPLLPRIQEMTSVPSWEGFCWETSEKIHDVVIKRIWPQVVFNGNGDGYKSIRYKMSNGKKNIERSCWACGRQFKNQRIYKMSTIPLKELQFAIIPLFLHFSRSFYCIYTSILRRSR